MRVTQEGSKFLEKKVVIKSTWEEKTQKPSPPPKAEILSILLNAKVRGLPQPYSLESAIVRGNGKLEVETRSFPKDYNVALPALTADSFLKIQLSYILGQTSKFLAPNTTEGLTEDPLLRRLQFADVKRKDFNKPIKVRRRLIRIIISYYKPLKDAMRNAGPKALIQAIRDSIIVYYKAYKLPESGFIHSSKFFIDILYTRR